MSYAQFIRGHLKKEECNPLKENILEMQRTQEKYYRRIVPSRISRTQNQQSTMEIIQEEYYWREEPFIISATLRYQTFFLGLCYSCNNFGNKDINYRAYAKYIRNYEGYSGINHRIKPHESYNKKKTFLAH